MKDLEQMLDLRFRKKQMGYAKIVSQEARLREQLRKLDDQAREAERSQDHQLRTIGADVIWKSWLERTKRSLNMELAQIMAQKEALKAGVRREYGKLLVGREMLEKQLLEEKASRKKQTLDTAIDSHVSRSSWGERSKGPRDQTPVDDRQN
ncbi:MAG: hypothetical protein AAF999_01555 [Pseudomonadota bacterium]